MNQKRRIYIENGIVIFIMLSSLMLLILSFFPFLSKSAGMVVSFEMGRMVQRAFSVVLLVIAFQLMKRKTSAWQITIIVLAFNVIHALARSHRPVHNLIAVTDIILILALIYFRKDFCCSSSKKAKSKAVISLALSFIGIIINAGISFHFVKIGISGNADISFADSLLGTIKMIFGMGMQLPVTRFGRGVELITFWFSWGCVLSSVLYAAEPWIDIRKSNEADLWHARTLLNRYGQNPCSYLALEEDKSLFFGTRVDGVAPYGAIGGTVVVNGDPVCADKDFPVLLEELKDFCQRSAHDLIILSVTEHFLPEYQKQGFGWVLSGEEARFYLPEYEISGKKGAKMRMNINHATKAGVKVHEYQVLKKRDSKIERGFERITQEWLQQKKGAMLKFTLGSAGLENPMDKRYFYAEDGAGEMVAFIVFVPFLGGKGYMADVTRHGKNAPGGVMETITYQAFQVFREEGAEYGSLGVAPLAGLEEDSSNPVERLLKFVYDHLNGCYGFRNLYSAKEKYSPTQWVPSYYVYYPRIPTPKMFYAVAKIQNPHGILDYVYSFIKEMRKTPKKEEK
ncbi:MAG: DUF2156 domain-containing protein [Muricomes sp.]